MDAFDTLGVEPRFDLDLPAIEARHRALSSALHPDKYAGASASERRMALGRAIEVNEAWRVLRDPIRRAECLLSRAGVAVGEAVEPKPAPGLLMEMMEAREGLASAHRTKDRAALDRLAAIMREKEGATLALLSQAFASSASGLDALLPELAKLRYFRRFFEELDAIEDDLLS